MLMFADPDADQIARDIVMLREDVQRFAGDELLRDPALNLVLFDRVGMSLPSVATYGISKRTVNQPGCCRGKSGIGSLAWNRNRNGCVW